ncbi:MAG: conjugal transfer protein TraN, partial [Pseudomonadota bacterium]
MTQGTCTDWQYRYLCGTPQTETGGTCRPVNVCAGGVCLETPEEESNDFGIAATWLNVLEEMVSDMRKQQISDPAEVRFFASKEYSCDV